MCFQRDACTDNVQPISHRKLSFHIKHCICRINICSKTAIYFVITMLLLLLLSWLILHFMCAINHINHELRWWFGLCKLHTLSAIIFEITFWILFCGSPHFYLKLRNFKTKCFYGHRKILIFPTLFPSSVHKSRFSQSKSLWRL